MSLGCKCGISSPNSIISWILETNFLAVVALIHCLLFIVRCYQIPLRLLPPLAHSPDSVHLPGRGASLLMFIFLGSTYFIKWQMS